MGKRGKPTRKDTRNARAAGPPSPGRERDGAAGQEAEKARRVRGCPMHRVGRRALLRVIHALHAQMYTRRQDDMTLAPSIESTSPCNHYAPLNSLEIALLGHGKSHTCRHTAHQDAHQDAHQRCASQPTARQEHHTQKSRASKALASAGRELAMGAHRAFSVVAHIEAGLLDHLLVCMVISVETRQLACQHLPRRAHAHVQAHTNTSYNTSYNKESVAGRRGTLARRE